MDCFSACRSSFKVDHPLDSMCHLQPPQSASTMPYTTQASPGMPTRPCFHIFLYERQCCGPGTIFWLCSDCPSLWIFTSLGYLWYCSKKVEDISALASCCEYVHWISFILVWRMCQCWEEWRLDDGFWFLFPGWRYSFLGESDLWRSAMAAGMYPLRCNLERMGVEDVRLTLGKLWPQGEKKKITW